MKLKRAWVIKEVFYLKWLANAVVVKKKNGKWQVCVDFTDQNGKFERKQLGCTLALLSILDDVKVKCRYSRCLSPINFIDFTL